MFERSEQVVINGVKLIVRRDGLKLPGTNKCLSSNTTISELAQAAGLKTYDTALPYEWVKAEYLNKGKEWPRGVWCYDGRSIFGHYVSVDDMLSAVAAHVK